MKNEINAVLENMTTTIPEPEDYTGEDGLLYCGKCRKPKEAYFAPDKAAIFGRDRHPAECDCQRAARKEREAAEKRRRHLDTVEELKRRGFTDAGAFLGMLLFEKTVGPIFVRYVSAALLWIKGVATKAMRVFLIPFRRMKSAAGRRAASGKRCLKRGFRLAKKRLTVWGRVAKMVLCGRRKRRQRGE